MIYVFFIALFAGIGVAGGLVAKWFESEKYATWWGFAALIWMGFMFAFVIDSIDRAAS